MAHPIAQVRTERHPASQIVMPFELLAPAAAFGLAFHQGQFQRLAFARGACNGRRLPASSGYVHPSWTSPAKVSHGGKSQQAFGLEPLQQLPAFVVLQASTGSCPLQQLADGTRDLGHAERTKIPRGLAHQLQFASVERASAKGEGFRHAVENGAAQPGYPLGPGTMSRIMARGARNSRTQRVKASLPCCQHVRSTLARISCVCAPSQVRFPPHTLRAITMLRIARSAALLVASSPG